MLIFAGPIWAQTNAGELRLKVLDPQGLPAKVVVHLRSEANGYRSVLATNELGEAVARRLPFGLYELRIEQEGFGAYADSIEIHSALPMEKSIHLGLAAVTSSVTVTDAATLLDPERLASAQELGSEKIEARTGSLPGRSLQDLVNSQPGWSYEGNAVLHPRGSEYQTQFVVDGIPLTDNRSPGFAPEIGADDVESMSIYTAGFPAEFGRKLGGVVEVNTFKDAKAGLHGEATLSGGSFATSGAYAQLQYNKGKNTFGASASGDVSSRYLNPVVPQNFTNTGTTGDYAFRYERDLTASDRIGVTLRHGFSRFEIPNDRAQQIAGQLQNGANAETTGVVSYQHIFSPDAIADFRGMVRSTSSQLTSNPVSTPIVAFQQNWFREGYFKGSVSLHRGRHEFKTGVESDNLFLHEDFRDIITDATQFDPGTPPAFAFLGNRPDLEQSAFAQDAMRLGRWSVSAGVRWDHYQLLVNQNAVSPRLSVSRYFSSLGLVAHISYDRIFQTPSFDNLLLSSSPAVASLNPQVVRLPVRPSLGNDFEAGISKAFFHQFRMDANLYRRGADNYADDDQLLNTAISFPIAFRKAAIYGAEGKLELPDWRGFSGYVSYSYMLGRAQLPVTGGLFLGNDADNAIGQISGIFPITQDQRNLVRTRFRYQAHPRLWFAAGLESESGLPFEFGGTEAEAVALFGQQVVDRVNFDRGRVRPQLAIDLSAGGEILRTDRVKMRLQADVRNLNDRLNVIDFNGVFSASAIGPPRSFFLRLTTSF
ncbi:MAG TPA: TonB-dependent receptor [Candidatus Acidoferrales bacterium]|nr:TonB-dependent receptor [Candidatus Acidoferrales bacterium]